MENLLEDKDIAKKILKELNNLVKIPTKGFLAGGAVANTILRMKYGKGEHNENLYPINDLDVFVEAEHQDISGNTPLRTKELTILEGYHGGEIGYDEGTNYRILSVGRDGLINTIIISQIIDIQNNRDYMYILNGFDFNCCQVGIDLETGNIIYTTKFEEFLKSNQLDVSAMYTPGHTAIRLFKKIKELKCYCNVDKCMEILSQPLIPSIRWRLMDRQWGFYFSDKYKDMFIEHYTSIKPYFKMVKFFDDKKDLWYQRHNELHPIKKSNDKSHVTNWLNPENSIPAELLTKWSEYNDKMWSLRPVKYSEPNEKIMDKAHLGWSSPIAFINAYQYINGKISKSLTKKCETILKNSSHLQSVVMINLDFADCDFSLKHVNELEEYCKRENDFIFAIQKYGLNLQESLILFRDIKKIQSKEGDWMRYIILDSLRGNNKNIKPNYDTLLKDVISHKVLMSKPLTTPLIDSKKIPFPKGIIIKEILCETEMQWAGNKLKNCINNPGQGYLEKIKSGLVRVFMVMTKGSTSALEIHLNSVDSIEVTEKQLLSSCNRKPSRFHRVIADMLINYINIELLESRYKDKIGLYNNMLTLQTGLLVTTSDDITDNNEEVFGFDAELPDFIDDTDDFLTDLDTTNRIVMDGTITPRRIDITNGGGETGQIRQWVNRTMNPQTLQFNYSTNTTLRDTDEDNLNDIWDGE